MRVGLESAKPDIGEVRPEADVAFQVHRDQAAQPGQVEWLGGNLVEPAQSQRTGAQLPIGQDVAHSCGAIACRGNGQVVRAIRLAAERYPETPVGCHDQIAIAHHRGAVDVRVFASGARHDLFGLCKVTGVDLDQQLGRSAVRVEVAQYLVASSALDPGHPVDRIRIVARRANAADGMAQPRARGVVGGPQEVGPRRALDHLAEDQRTGPLCDRFCDGGCSRRNLAAWRRCEFRHHLRLDRPDRRVVLHREQHPLGHDLRRRGEPWPVSRCGVRQPCHAPARRQSHPACHQRERVPPPQLVHRSAPGMWLDGIIGRSGTSVGNPTSEGHWVSRRRSRTSRSSTPGRRCTPPW